MVSRVLLLSIAMLLVHVPAWGQAVSGVRGLNGGVGALHNLPGPDGSLYLDGQGSTGYIYNAGTFESYNFQIPYGPSWMGSMMTMGPQLSIGLISGANQSSFSRSTGTTALVSAPTVIPPPPRSLPPLPPIESSILEDIP
jgi:hypothetical protein